MESEHIVRYIKYVVIVVLMVIEFGFLGPYLISASNDEMVIGGIVMIIVSIPAYIFALSPEIKAIVNKIRK